MTLTSVTCWVLLVFAGAVWFWANHKDGGKH